MDYLMGPLSFMSRIQDFYVPPPPIGVDYSYLSFTISGTTPTPQAALRMQSRTHVHFDHALDHVYDSHLTQGIDMLSTETDLGRASDALVTVIHKAATGSFPTTRSSTHARTGTMPQHPGLMMNVEN